MLLCRFRQSSRFNAAVSTIQYCRFPSASIPDSPVDYATKTKNHDLTNSQDIVLHLMALITVSGYPASGKTRRVEQLKAFLEKKLQDTSYTGPLSKVVSISDDSLSIKRSVYDGELEKRARCMYPHLCRR